MGLPPIDPPLLNSANPWATTEEDLQRLFDCPYTGAITTRTSLLNGFEHDDAVHQYTYFDNDTHRSANDHPKDAVGSLNTLGYSPIPLRDYLGIVERVINKSSLPEDTRRSKLCIISVTGSVEEVVECYQLISNKQDDKRRFCMEVNLSCPNIPNKPPPAYSKPAMLEYIQALGRTKNNVPIGLKTPPYTYHDQYTALIDAILESPGVDFITATNTLGSSIILNDTGKPAIPSASGSGIGGLAGVPLHPLSLGNVRTIRSMLDQHSSLQHIDIIGVGGVYDKAGFDRMRLVGAKVVAIGTALGAQGIDVFKRISQTSG